MMDQNRDGFIDKDDLIEMLTSLGKNPTDRDVVSPSRHVEMEFFLKILVLVRSFHLGGYHTSMWLNI